MIKRIVSLLVSTAMLLTADAQQLQGGWRWWDPATAKTPVIEGAGWPGETALPYDRFPQRAEALLRPVVWIKSRQTAGLLIRFRSDAALLRVRYRVGGPTAFEHMPATGVSGLDLYAADGKGEWRWPGLEYVYGDTISYTFHVGGGDREYMLYLPLYNSVQWLQLGVPDTARLTPLPARRDGLVVVYGTSIAQGGCASRPGMAWTAILGRRLGLPVVNLGFSSNGLLEPAVIGLMAELKANVYILDCLPNMLTLPADTTRTRILSAVLALRRRKPGTPIVLTECADANIGLMDTALDRHYHAVNKIGEEAFRALKSQGVRNIYYLPASVIGLDAESTVDGAHPSDRGMEQYADAYARLLKKILKR